MRARGMHDSPTYGPDCTTDRSSNGAEISFGTTVNVADRLAAQAGGGQILATRPVGDAAPSLGVQVRGLGCMTLHNLTIPVELFKLVRDDANDRDVDPVCRMRVNPATAAGRLTYAGSDYLFCSLDCAGKFAARPDRFTSVE
jgi:adenylate cyclase